MKTIKQKMKGLMFSKKVKERLLFIFESETKSKFHSFFCPDFDILFLDEKGKIVYLKEIRKPQVIDPGKKYRCVLESEPGFIKKKKIKVGDIIRF